MRSRPRLDPARSDPRRGREGGGGQVSDRPDLDELDALEKAATPGPWTVCRHPTASNPRVLVANEVEQKIVTEWKYDGATDHALIAALRNAAPELIAELREARAKIDRLTARGIEDMQHELREVRALLLEAQETYRAAANEIADDADIGQAWGVLEIYAERLDAFLARKQEPPHA